MNRFSAMANVVGKKTLSVLLPWQAKELNPNHKIHWAALARVKRAAREAASEIATKEMGIFNETPSQVDVFFFPPDRRRRDKLNMIASFKAAQDGVADAIKWDDRHWNEDYHVCEPVSGGAIEVVFTFEQGAVESAKEVSR